MHSVRLWLMQTVEASMLPTPRPPQNWQELRSIYGLFRRDLSQFERYFAACVAFGFVPREAGGWLAAERSDASVHPAGASPDGSSPRHPPAKIIPRRLA